MSSRISSFFSFNKVSSAPKEVSDPVNSKVTRTASSFFGRLVGSVSSPKLLDSVSIQPQNLDDLAKMFPSPDMSLEEVKEQLAVLKNAQIILNTDPDLFKNGTSYVGPNLMNQLEVDIPRLTGAGGLYLNGEKLPKLTAQKFIQKIKELAPDLSEDELNTLFSSIQQGGILGQTFAPIQEKIGGSIRFKPKSCPDNKMSITIKSEQTADANIKKSRVSIECTKSFSIQSSFDGEADLETEMVAKIMVDLKTKTAACHWEFLDDVSLTNQLKGKTNEQIQSVLQSLEGKSIYPKFMDNRFFHECNKFKPDLNETLEEQIDKDFSRDTKAGIVSINKEKVSQMSGNEFIELLKKTGGNENLIPLMTLLQQGGARFAIFNNLMEQQLGNCVMLSDMSRSHNSIDIRVEQMQDSDGLPASRIHLEFVKSFALISLDGKDLNLRINSVTSINLNSEQATLKYEICNEEEFETNTESGK